MSTVTLQVGHSPDPDDAFMFYALAHGKIDTGDLDFEHVIEGIETLNRWALDARLPVTAISVHAYGHVADRYRILRCGASVGDRYGPIVVSRSPRALGDLAGTRVAVPGRLTTAFLVLSLALPRFTPIEVPFDRILEVVSRGEADAGVVIHEGQLTYAEQRLHKVADLGEWWHAETGGLPLPLGLDVARDDLGEDRMREVARCLTESIRYAHEHREEALAYALRFGRGIGNETADRFVGMYVNDATVSMGSREEGGIRALLDRAFEARLLPRRATLRFVEETPLIL